MITAITGELGIGKTAEMSKILYESYLDGCLCISNYHHVYSHVICSNPEETLELIRQIGEFKRHGYETCDLLPTFKHTGISLFIDEGHLTFSPDLKSSSPEMQFSLQFISMCRKQDVAIYVVAQDPALLSKTIRRYVREWINLKAVIPLFRKLWVPHPTRPTFRRQRRLLIPFIWYETHHLDYENPVFNYARVVTDKEFGITELAPHATLKSRSLQRVANKFIHSLYDSYEMVGMDLKRKDGEEESYDLLKTVSYIPHSMKPEKFPTFKRWLGIKRNDAEAPIRYRFKNIELPKGVSSDMTTGVVKQPEKTLEDISVFLKIRQNKVLVERKTRNLIIHTTPKHD